MNRVELRNTQSNLIAWIDKVYGGRKQIRYSKGTLLGWYDPDSNRTTSTKTGNWIGIGDQLTSLL